MLGKHSLMFNVRCILSVLPLFYLVGCGDGLPASKLDRQALSGTVMLDSAPLPNGSIEFHPLSATGASTISGGIISDGKFELKKEAGLPPGKYKVVINASPPASNTTTDPIAAMDAAAKPIEEGLTLPEKYNLNTELTCEIVVGLNDKLSFDLKSGS